VGLLKRARWALAPTLKHQRVCACYRVVNSKLRVSRHISQQTNSKLVISQGNSTVRIAAVINLSQFVT